MNPLRKKIQKLEKKLKRLRHAAAAVEKLTTENSLFTELKFRQFDPVPAETPPERPEWHDDNQILAEAVPEIKSHILAEAGRIVTGARRGAYGTPENNFERIARLWTAYMLNTDRECFITAEDVSPMMRLMKEARLCETPDHLDSHVDLVGYTLTGAEVNRVKP